MRIGIVSEEAHVNSHKRALEERGHDVVLLGGSPTKIPPTVEVVLLRTVGCSHNASDTAFAWQRAGHGHLIVADGVAATLSAVAAYEAKLSPPTPSSVLTDAQYDKLADRLERAMAGEDGCRMDKGTIFVVGGRKADLDLIENVAHIAGMRRTGNIAGTSRTVPARLVQDCSVVVMLEHRTGSRLQQIVSELCLKTCKPLVALDASSGETDLLIRLGQAGFPPVNHLVAVSQMILRGRHISECSTEEQEAMSHVVLGEHATGRMPSSTRKDRHAILVRTILAQPNRSDEEILNAALDAALHPEKLVEIHPHHIDAARDEVGVVVDDEGNPVAIHGQRMIEAASRYNVGNANIDALPWLTDEPAPLETPEPEPIPEPETTIQPEIVMPTKTKRKYTREPGKPHSTAEQKFGMLVSIFRENPALTNDGAVKFLKERLENEGFVVPENFVLSFARARKVASTKAKAKVPDVIVPIDAPAPVVPAPAPAAVVLAPEATLDERVRAAVTALQALMREARITSAQLTPDSAALEVEVVTVTRTTLRF